MTNNNNFVNFLRNCGVRQANLPTFYKTEIIKEELIKRKYPLPFIDFAIDYPPIE